MGEVRVVLSQCGAALELHGVNDIPITLLLLRPTQLEYYRDVLSEQNPDMRHASIGQIAMFAAKRLCHTPVNPHLWQYNASTNTYSIY